MEAQARPQPDAGFLSGPILPPLIRFSLPLMLSLLLQALYGGVDLAVVGWFSTTAHVSAVATGSQMMQAVTVVITGLTMGVTVLLGHALGADDPKRAGDVTAGQVRLFFPLALLCTLVMLLLAPWFTRLMQVPDAAVDATVSYIRICSSGMVFITAYNVISGLFRGIGNSRSPFLFVLIACLVNIILDLLFVGAFRMGAAGAAWATVLAQAVSVAFSMGYLRRHPFSFPVGLANLRAPGVPFGILRVGGPIALQELLVHISFLIITSIVNRLGLVASAGIGISEKLFVFLAIAPMAFMSALSAFVAQNMGACNPQRALRAMYVAQAISFACGVLTFLLTFFAGSFLASIFDGDPAVIQATAQYMRGSSFEYLMIPFTFCYLGYFNGRQRTAFVMIQGLVSAFLARIPLSYFLSSLPGASLFTISLAVPAASLLSLGLCVAYFLHMRRQEPVSWEIIP